MSGVGITFDETHSFRDWGLKTQEDRDRNTESKN